MKRLFFGVCGLIFVCFVIVLAKKYFSAHKTIEVELIEIKLETVNETATCNGYLSAVNSKNYKTGCPAEIIYIPVSEGEYVNKGDVLFSYRALNSEEIKTSIDEIISKELQNSSQKLTSEIDSADILSAAAYYAENGRIPSWFSDYYLPSEHEQNRSSFEYRIVYAEFDGKIKKIDVTVGDMITGALGAVLVADESNLVADVSIPEAYVGAVTLGQYANLNGASFSGVQISARIESISDSARTVGGILGSAETVVDCRLNITSNTEGLIPGLSVRADIFINTWKDATVIPYSAVYSENGKEYVWVFVDGIINKLEIEPVYKYTEGVVVEGLFNGGELIVNDPANEFRDGMSVEFEMVAE